TSCDEVVQVQQDAGDQRPDSRLFGINSLEAPGREEGLFRLWIQHLFLLPVILLESLFLVRSWSARQTELECVIDARAEARRRLPEHTEGQALGCLEKHRIIQKIQGLQRRGGALAPAARKQRIGSVESHQLRIGNRPLKENVESATVAVGSRTFFPARSEVIRN